MCFSSADMMRPGYIHGSGRRDDPRAGYTYWPLQRVDVRGQWREDAFAVALYLLLGMMLASALPRHRATMKRTVPIGVPPLAVAHHAADPLQQCDAAEDHVSSMTKRAIKIRNEAAQ
jgi:hypothetical protein